MMAIAAVGNNLITYVFNDMHFPLSKSANIVTNFIGTVFLLSLLGGFLSDSYLGSFRTMLAFGFVELSVCLLTSTACFRFQTQPSEQAFSVVDVRASYCSRCKHTSPN